MLCRAAQNRFSLFVKPVPAVDILFSDVQALSVASPFNWCLGGASSCLQDQTAAAGTSAICMDQKEGRSERSFCEVFSTISRAVLMLTSSCFFTAEQPRFRLFLLIYATLLQGG